LEWDDRIPSFDEVHDEARHKMVSNAMREFPRRTKIRRSSLPKPAKAYLAV
jgi:hypothetical protein